MNEFFGRPINEGANSFHFDLCEICLHKSPNWIEVMGNKSDGFVIRVSCDECHNDFEKEGVNEELYARQVIDENEVTETVRPGWVEEFISSSDTIENIDQTQTSDEGATSPSNWVKDFIDEALFGTNPVNWMEENNLMSVDKAMDSVVILSQLSINDLASVKLAAIECLFAIFSRHREMVEIVKSGLQGFTSDVNEVVANHASDTISKF